MALPDRVDRTAVRSVAASEGTAPETARDALIAAMVSGYGNRGYARWRTQRVLNGAPDAALRLVTVARALANDGL